MTYSDIVAVVGMSVVQTKGDFSLFEALFKRTAREEGTILGQEGRENKNTSYWWKVLHFYTVILMWRR